jgi:hypothetical protein
MKYQKAQCAGMSRRKFPHSGLTVLLVQDTVTGVLAKYNDLI